MSSDRLWRSQTILKITFMFTHLLIAIYLYRHGILQRNLNWIKHQEKHLSIISMDREKKIAVAWQSSVTDLLISFLTFSVPLGSFPPHIPGPLTVDCFIEVLFILYCCMQITKVGHTEGNCYEPKCHHRLVRFNEKLWVHSSEEHSCLNSSQSRFSLFGCFASIWRVSGRHFN